MPKGFVPVAFVFGEVALHFGEVAPHFGSVPIVCGEEAVGCVSPDCGEAVPIDSGEAVSFDFGEEAIVCGDVAQRFSAVAPQFFEMVIHFGTVVLGFGDVPVDFGFDAPGGIRVSEGDAPGDDSNRGDDGFHSVSRFGGRVMFLCYPVTGVVSIYFLFSEHNLPPASCVSMAISLWIALRGYMKRMDIGG